MSTAAIEVHSLTYELGGNSILQDVELRIEKGCSVAIIGPNGAGKTSLLRCLMRVLHPTRGRVTVFGTPTNRMSQRQLAKVMSYLPQTNSSDAAFSVREFVQLGRYPHRRFLATQTPKDDAIVSSALKTTSTAQFAERNISTLSGGERQRVAIAAAIAQSTRILLVDEPTAHLDYKHQIEMTGLLRELHSEHKLTLVCVTHHLNRSVFECDHVIGLKKGSVLFAGSPQDCLNAAHLEELYDVSFRFLTDPQSGQTVVLPAGES